MAYASIPRAEVFPALLKRAFECREPDVLSLTEMALLERVFTGREPSTVCHLETLEVSKFTEPVGFGWGCLLACAASGWPELAMWMLERGADPRQAPHAGADVLIGAIFGENFELISALIDRVGVNSVGRAGQTPLSATISGAAGFSGRATLRALLRHEELDREVWVDGAPWEKKDAPRMCAKAFAWWMGQGWAAEMLEE